MTGGPVPAPTRQPVESVTVSPDETCIVVADGRIKEVMGGIQFFGAGEDQRPFTIRRDNIREVRNLVDGNLIWLNSREKGSYPNHKNQSYFEHKGGYLIMVYEGTSTDPVPITHTL